MERSGSEKVRRGAAGIASRPGRNPRIRPYRKVVALPVSELRMGIPLALRGDAEADILAVVARLVFDGDDGAFGYASLDLCVFIDDKVHRALVGAIIHLQRERLALVTDRRDFSGDRFCYPLGLFSGLVLRWGFMRDGRHTRHQETGKR